jgi:hypothetical protein
VAESWRKACGTGLRPKRPGKTHWRGRRRWRQPDSQPSGLLDTIVTLAPLLGCLWNGDRQDQFVSAS